MGRAGRYSEEHVDQDARAAPRELPDRSRSEDQKRGWAGETQLSVTQMEADSGSHGGKGQVVDESPGVGGRYKRREDSSY